MQERDKVMSQLLKNHKLNYEEGEKHRKNAQRTIDSAIKYAAPTLETIDEASLEFYNKESKERVAGIWDTTLINAFEEYIDTMKSRMFPSTSKWFKIEINPLIERELSEEDKKDVQTIERLTWHCMSISNFQFILDIILKDYNISTALTRVAYTGNKSNPLVYESFPFGSFILGTPRPDGKIKEVYVERKKLSKMDVENIFPMVRFCNSDEEEENPDCLVNGLEEYNLIEFVTTSNTFMETKNGHQAEWFEYYVVDSEFTKVLYTEILPYNPFVVSRIAPTNDGSRYGKGRLVGIIPTFATLNQITESETRAIVWDSNPAKAVILGGMSGSKLDATKVVFEAGKATALPQDSQVIDIKSGLDINATRVKIQDYRRLIFDALAVRPMGSFEDTKYKTAQEMYQREKENERILTSRYATTINQVSAPLVETTMSVLEYHDIFNFPKNFDAYIIKYVNPVTQNQKVDEVQKIIAVITLLRTIYGVNIPNVIMNDEEVLSAIIDSIDVDRDLLLPEDEIKARIDQILMNMQQAQAEQQVAEGGQQ